MEKKISTSLLSLALAFAALPMQAQVSAADSVMAHAGGHRLSVGGYGEAAYSRNFYSDNVYRYSRASQYKHDPSHGRFDIPHAVIYLGYDFGKGWTMGSEIEFEHTGTGSSVEQEYEESGEWETDTEKGGEVELEQFWLQKSFARWANIRAEDRLHDCRARNEIEAIMWHGYSKNSQAYFAAAKFYKLSKKDRDCVVKFLRAI